MHFLVTRLSELHNIVNVVAQLLIVTQRLKRAGFAPTLTSLVHSGSELFRDDLEIIAILVLDGLVKLRGLSEAEFFKARWRPPAERVPQRLSLVHWQQCSINDNLERNEMQSAGSDAAKTHTIHVKM